MRFAFVFIAASPLLALAIACSGPDSQLVSDGARIIGGQEADYTEGFTRHAVAIGNSNGATCSGSILSDRLVLTAAHCVDKPHGGPTPASEISILFGTRVGGGEAAFVRQVELYRTTPGWHYEGERFDMGADLAILRFSGGLPVGYEPVELLRDADTLVDGAEIIHVGNGGTGYTGGGRDDLLRYVRTKFVLSERKTVTEITRAWIGRLEPKSFFWTAVQDKKAICNGDSGGPSFVLHDGKWKQWGVTSGYTDYNGDHCLVDSFFTSVPYRAEWILEMIGKLGGETLPLDSLDIEG